MPAFTGVRKRIKATSVEPAADSADERTSTAEPGKA